MSGCVDRAPIPPFYFVPIEARSRVFSLPRLQPFADGSTQFERILPGPDRMYPDTDSPPQRIVSERVERLQANLPQPPWIRQHRYREAGVPLPVIHFLIRRGDARRVDRVVERVGTEIKFACFFFGEQLKGLRPSSGESEITAAV